MKTKTIITTYITKAQNVHKEKQEQFFQKSKLNNKEIRK